MKEANKYSTCVHGVGGDSFSSMTMAGVSGVSALKGLVLWLGAECLGQTSRAASVEVDFLAARLCFGECLEECLNFPPVYVGAHIDPPMKKFR